MIDLYSWPTPNGVKLHVLLEELEIPYTVHPVNIRKGEQFEAEFLKISPNNKIPAMVDQDGPGGKPYSLFESGAMMMYLAEKTGKLMPTEMAARYDVIAWLMFQMASVGPMFGQHNHFRSYAPEGNEYGITRYGNEVMRLYNVMDKRLGEVEWLGGGEYSIADIANWAWAQGYERRGIDLSEHPNALRWIEAIRERPATQRGMKVLDEHRGQQTRPDKETLENYFGAAQMARR